MDTQTKTGMIIIAFSILILAITFVMQPFKSYIDVLIIFTSLAIALVVFFYSPIQENFNNTTAINPVLTALSLHNDNGAENISSFSSGLTIYYSAFTPSSYPRNSRTWFNISPFFNTIKSDCNMTLIENTHAQFTEQPGFSKATGFSLGTNKLSGPMSYKLGISLNDSFTIAFTIQFDAFSSVLPSSSMELIKLYANTNGNNGLSLYIAPDYQNVNGGTDYKVNMFMTFGDSDPIPINQAPLINTGYIYIIVITKLGNQLQLDIFPNIVDLNSTINYVSSFNITLPTTDVMLSNKEMIINRNGTLQAHLFNIAIWNRSIGIVNIAPFYRNVQIELQKTNPTLINYAQQYTALQKQLQSANGCPYDSQTCDACSGVTQWNNMSDVILNGGPKCMELIDNYCTNHPSNKVCACWNSSSALSKTAECAQYRSIYRANENKDMPKCIDNLDEKSLKIIRSKFNLCSCGEIPPQPVVKKNLVPPPPIPKLISSVYSINQSDIDMYNTIPIGAKPAPLSAKIDTTIFDPLLKLISRN